VSESPLRRSSTARVNKGSHSFTCHPHEHTQVKWTIPAFTPQQQSITAVWLVLSECRRLSWAGWLDEILSSTTVVVVVCLCVMWQSEPGGVGGAGWDAAAERYSAFSCVTVLLVLIHWVHVPGELRPRPACPPAAARRQAWCREDENEVWCRVFALHWKPRP